jgi:lipid II:glycine glycyltransferase (peptidoglycan interpeptide bridge formation enzyme)
MLRFRDYLVYGYGASSLTARNIPANKLILWERIRDACATGVRSFDLGRVSYDNEGLIQFKRGWGAREEKLYYSYYPAPAGTLSHTRNTLPFRIGSAVLRTLPVPLFALLSDRSFGSFG